MEAKFFVGGISPQTNDEALLEYFSTFGDVVEAVAMMKKGVARGFGFVTFANSESLPEDFMAVSHIIDGRPVEIKPAVPEATAGMAAAPVAQGFGGQEPKLFIGGITKTTQTPQLEEYFSQFGVLTDVIAMNFDGQPRGFGFVTFSTMEEMEGCLQYGEHVINGKVVDVKRAEPKGSPMLAPPGQALSYQPPRLLVNRYAPARRAYGASVMPIYTAARALPQLAARRGYVRAAAPYPSAPVVRPWGGLGAPLPYEYSPPVAYRATPGPQRAVSLEATPKVFVGGLPPDADEDMVASFFSQFGTVIECEIRRREGGLPRGFGFVTFQTVEETRDALAPHYHDMYGKTVEVKPCLPKALAPPPQRAAAPGPRARPTYATAPMAHMAAPVRRMMAAPPVRRPLYALARPY